LREDIGLVTHLSSSTCC